MQTRLSGKDFISTEDWSVEELVSMMDVAGDLKRRFAIGEPHNHILASKTLFMLFFEESTRTRTSFESGMTQLGGHAIYLTPSATQVGHGENARDTGGGDAALWSRDCCSRLPNRHRTKIPV